MLRDEFQAHSACADESVRQSMSIGRFAPSPTGALHLGSLTTALASWLSTRRHGGAWLVRIEDIDPPREVAGSAHAIIAALSAFGLEADAPVLFQSKRVDAYLAAFECLRATGLLFPCWCSRNDLAAHGGKHQDGQCVAPAKLSPSPAWRIHAPDTFISFDDGIQGRQRQNLRDSVGDFVIRRADGQYSYQLACVVDDAYQNITEVVRGCDLLDSTPRQIWLQQLLKLPTPRYLHLPLVRDKQGGKLSKSDGSLPFDVDQPLTALCAALECLHQPTQKIDTSSVSAILRDAVKHFDPNNLCLSPA